MLRPEARRPPPAPATSNGCGWDPRTWGRCVRDAGQTALHTTSMATGDAYGVASDRGWLPNVIGWCVTGSIGAVIGATGGACLVVDDKGYGTYETVGAGLYLG